MRSITFAPPPDNLPTADNYSSARSSASGPELVTLAEAAAVLRVSRTTLYRMVESRLLPFYRVRRTLRFDRADLLSYLARQRVAPIQ